jgi:hypothetical protein
MRESDCDSWDISEGYRAVRVFGSLTRYRVHVGPTRNAHDVPVLVRRHNRYVGEASFKVSDELPQFERVGKERHINMAVYEWQDITIAHIGLHPVAGPKALTGTDANHPLVKAYQAAVGATAHALDLCDAMGWWPVLGADRQVKATSGLRPWSLEPMLRAHMMNVVAADGLDIIAVDKRLTLHGDVKVYKPRQTGSDSHNWLVAELRKR